MGPKQVSVHLVVDAGPWAALAQAKGDCFGAPCRPKPHALYCSLSSQLLSKGNPLARDNRYATAIKQATAVETLDDVLLRDPPRCSALSSFSWALLGESVADVMNSSQTKEDLKTSARRIFLERLQHKRDDTESAVHHLHSRIL